jgi:hypothetical protein
MMMLLTGATSGWGAELGAVPNDREVASIVVGKDGPSEVESKLGQSPCLVPSVSGETMSYLYNVQGSEGRYFLRLEMNGRVDAITVSKDPPLTGVCYAPVRQAAPLRTERGLQLGATSEEVITLYGRPTESFAVGSMARFRYVAVLERPYEWDLVFRNGRLVEWTVAAEE